MPVISYLLVRRGGGGGVLLRSYLETLSSLVCLLLF